MASQENHGAAEFNLPPNMEDLLRTGLTPFRETRGYATPLYNVDNHPDLLVRLSHTEDFAEEVAQALASLEDVARFGICVLPSQLFVVDGHCHVVTKKVTGQSLSDILQTPTDHILERTDTLYSGIGHYTIEAMQLGKRVAGDIDDPTQYMQGLISGDSMPKLWLTDLPDGTADLAHPRLKDQNYNLAIMAWVNGIIDVENLTGATLSTARQTTAEAFELSGHTYLGERWVAAFQDALKSRQILDSDEPPIADLRTF